MGEKNLNKKKIINYTLPNFRRSRKNPEINIFRKKDLQAVNSSLVGQGISDSISPNEERQLNTDAKHAVYMQIY